MNDTDNANDNNDNQSIASIPIDEKVHSSPTSLTTDKQVEKPYSSEFDVVRRRNLYWLILKYTQGPRNGSL